ncbi:MAG: hypothetical protein H6830_03250 [Planctomycetes bacterium]|nr:hypothetical protein [Planctomycetota bacterium]MCB9910691.1 hypothetical protein [Planctomycetota bacterium]HPF15018.1 hypothetical protein [Planctomycetota bacterium]
MAGALGVLVVGAQALDSASAADTDSVAQETVEGTQEIGIRVLWVRETQVRIDLGSQSGLQLGDRVRLEPLGRPDVEGVVTEISDLEATVTLTRSDPGVVPGVSGRVRVTPNSLGEQAQPKPPVPPIVWTDQPQEWREGMPLLGDIQPVKPEERPTHWTGRLELSGNFFRDGTATVRDDRQFLVRTGWVATNPFGHGGELQLQLDYQANSLSVGDSAVGVVDDSDAYLRIQRASYAWGGTRFEPRRIEAGRFYSRWFPELGILDGVEVSERLSDGSHVGASAGFLPGFDVELPFQNDLALAAFWDHPWGAKGRSNVGAAAQTTWYDGTPDRQWFLVKGRMAEMENWVLDGGLEGDLYTSDDIAKDPGLEWTQSRVRLERRFDRDGAASVYYFDQRWPETLRGLPVIQDPTFLFVAHTQRVGVDGWWQNTDTTRISSRLERWEDEDSSGSLGELGYDQELEGDRFTGWRISGYWSDTDLADITALRLGLAGRAFLGFWDTSLEVGQFEILDQLGGLSAHSKGVWRGQWTGAVGHDWSLILHGAMFFGGDQDAYSAGFSLLRSF